MNIRRGRSAVRGRRPRAAGRLLPVAPPTDRSFPPASGPRAAPVHPGSVGPSEEPGLEVLPLKLDLRDGADRLDQLEERSRRLAALGHRATQDEWSLRVRRSDIAPSWPITSLGIARTSVAVRRAAHRRARGWPGPGAGSPASSLASTSVGRRSPTSSNARSRSTHGSLAQRRMTTAGDVIARTLPPAPDP